MKPILYIDQQISAAQTRLVKLIKYVDGTKQLRKTDIREIISELSYHLNEARNTFPSEENHETEEERNAIPDEFKDQ